MALWKLTVKSTRIMNGVRLERGMSVQVSNAGQHPIGYQNGEAVYQAFLRVHGVDLRKAGALHPAYFDIEREG